MKKIKAISMILLIVLVITGCRGKNFNDEKNSESTEGQAYEKNAADTEKKDAKEMSTDDHPAVSISEEQALDAVRNYCYKANPDLKGVEESDKSTVYWDIAESDENRIVILYRSYTGAQIRYYIDRASGDTYSTEFVPGITEQEERTDESFNIRDYLRAD